MIRIQRKLKTAAAIFLALGFAANAFASESDCTNAIDRLLSGNLNAEEIRAQAKEAETGVAAGIKAKPEKSAPLPKSAPDFGASTGGVSRVQPKYDLTTGVVKYEVSATEVPLKRPDVLGGQSTLKTEKFIYEVKPGADAEELAYEAFGPTSKPELFAKGGLQKVYKDASHPDHLMKIFDPTLIKAESPAEAQKLIAKLIQRQKDYGKLLESKIIPNLNKGGMGDIKVTMVEGLAETNSVGATKVKAVHIGPIGDTGEQWLDANTVWKDRKLSKIFPSGVPSMDELNHAQKTFNTAMKPYHEAIDGVNEALDIPLSKGGKAIGWDFGHDTDNMTNLFIRADKNGKILEIRIGDI